MAESKHNNLELDNDGEVVSTPQHDDVRIADRDVEPVAKEDKPAKDETVYHETVGDENIALVDPSIGGIPAEKGGSEVPFIPPLVKEYKEGSDEEEAEENSPKRSKKVKVEVDPADEDATE
jgi:hypothetical protein